LAAGKLEEYCLLETFRPRCWKNEVIIIEEAIYGRRHIGKCISSKEASLVQNPQYLGCSANVLHVVGQKCSGRRECVVSVPDPDLEQTMPCLEGLKMFLEVRYSCVESTLTDSIDETMEPTGSQIAHYKSAVFVLNSHM